MHGEWLDTSERRGESEKVNMGIPKVLGDIERQNVKG